MQLSYLTKLLIFIGAIFLFFANSSNPPNGRTGAPGEGTCNNCHSGGATFDGGITISGLPMSAQAGNTYPLVINVENPNGLASEAGFQIVALNSSDTNAGTLSNAGPNSTISSSSGRSYHEHNPAQNFPGSNLISWTVDWTAPSGPNNELITFYMAGNIANGNGNTGGDKIVYQTKSTNLIASIAPVTVSINLINNVSCNDGNDGSAEAIAIDGTPPYFYAWSNGENTAIATMLTGGVHQVTVSDSGGGTASASINITEPNTLQADHIINNNALCNGDSNGSAFLIGTGGTSPYSYKWSDGNTTQENNSLSAGVYQFTITDNNNCTATNSLTITEPEPLSGTTTIISEPSCHGAADGIVSASASGGTSPYVYTWSNGGSGESQSNLTAGDYMVTVIDNNTCTLILEFSLTEPTQIVVNLDEIIQVDCFGNETGSIDVSGSGGVPPYNFQWSNGDNSAQILNLTGGTYSVTVSDNTGCTEIASFEITEPEVLLSEVTINALPLCFGDSTGLAMVTSSGGTGNYSYLWSNGETGNIAENLVAGDYYVITSDQNNCADTVSFTITQPDELELALSATNETAEGAADGTATVAVSGGQSPYTFMWSNDSTSQSITELTPGNYTVTVTDANNCEASGTVTISAVNCLLAVELFIQDESCLNASDGVIQTSVSGGTEPYIYTWSNGSNDSTQIQLPAGSYSVTIIDADSCSIEAEGIVNMGNEVIFEFGNIIQPVCQDDETGQIGITITSGQAPFNIVWSTGDTTSATTGVKPGSYSVTVSDNAACSYSDNFVLEHLDTIPPEIICPIINTSYCGPTVIEYPFPTFIDNCPGGTIEQIAGIGSGNEFPIGEHTEVFLATDASGNADTCSFTFIISGDFITTAITEDESCAGLCDGSVTIEISGGAPPYSITPENFDNLCAGIYTYSITDAQGCEVEISIEIEAAPEFLLVSVDAMDASSTGNDGFIDIEIEGGAQPFVYDWTKDGDPFSDQEDISDLGPGVYNCMITDANGCVISTEEIIIEMESSTNELNLLESVEIYPNPASNVLMIKWDQIPSNNIEYAIKGVDGKIWKSKAWNGELISQINVDDLPEAIYFVHLRSEQSQYVKRVLIIRD